MLKAFHCNFVDILKGSCEDGLHSQFGEGFCAIANMTS